MDTRNRCYTYFKIEGIFDPDDISEILALTPENTRKASDLRNDGRAYGSALWEIERCEAYDVYVGNQMRQTIALLKDKIPLLDRIKQKYDVSFVLEIVPHIYAGDTAPCLAPPLDIIDFCHETRTEIDIDLYVYSSEER